MRILVVGPPGAGKTYLVSYLQQKNVTALDADAVPDLCSWIDNIGEKIAYPADASKQWIESHRYVWDEAVLSQAVSQHEHILIAGIATNCWDVKGLFDQHYCLHVPTAALTKRLNSPSRFNSFGTTPDQMQYVKEGTEIIYSTASKHGFVTVDATQSPQHIAAEMGLLQ